ncbi:MAG: flagellar biosynthesis protein FlgA, partial [Proteobacteria bacterium]|nr:flagellar biosynthesis protein FlgA [Pseudomonadota bacterium]
LDGEGGFTVWGRIMAASDSLARGALPIGLAQGVELLRAVPAGQALTWADIAIDEAEEAVRVRREMEAAFAPAGVPGRAPGDAEAAE